MRVTRQRQIMGALGVCLLTVFILRQAGRWSPAPPPRCFLTPPFRAASRGPFDQALSEAKLWWFRADTRVADEEAALDEWDPDPRSNRKAESCREGLLAHAPETICACQAARQALTQARSRTEAAQALQMLALIECKSGHHQAELRAADLCVEGGADDAPIMPMGLYIDGATRGRGPPHLAGRDALSLSLPRFGRAPASRRARPI